jgi:hypothetical protein
MPMRDQDTKKLWARSGNLCSFPGCGQELAPDRQANRVIGEEAHIKGEKPRAPRYDANQSDEERNGYSNRILLCPNHHTQIDAEPDVWTVERLLIMKREHERQIVSNRQHPLLIGELKRILQLYDELENEDSISVQDIIEDSNQVRVIRVDASIEEGFDTGIRVVAGQTIQFFARGLITFDGGTYFSNPEGIICNAYGIPFSVQNEEGQIGAVIMPHNQAYMTIQGIGHVGSLIGWINEYNPDRAFFIGAKREVVASESGSLYLAINDAKGTYADNDGEYRVDIRIVK